MNPMLGPLRRFALTLAIAWVVLAAAGIVYARVLDLPARLAAPIVAAFLWEASFYLTLAFAEVRAAIEQRWRPPLVGAGLAASAVLPYLVYALPTGTFHWTSAAILAALAVVAAFWFLMLPRNPFWDAAFVVLMAAVVLGKLFSRIYLSPVPGVHLEILGQLAWTRLGIWIILSFRRQEGIGFGFIPVRAEWLSGIRQYLYFLPLGLPLGLVSGVLRFQPVQMEWWKAAGLAAGTFLGILWVVALAEEFFFRGLLQQWFSNWLHSRTAGLILASVAFGLVHLPFRGFPNWGFALIATIAGVFYGRAYFQSGSIRAAMVTHALVVTTMRVFFAPG